LTIDDCGLLIFEVTEGRILSLPIANQQSSIINHQSSILPTIPLVPVRMPPQ
jgi:hypothetical protein